MNTTIIHAHELQAIEAVRHAHAGMAVAGAALFAALVLFLALWVNKRRGRL